MEPLEELYLTSDIIVHHFTHRRGVADQDSSEQADRFIERVQERQLLAYISDTVLLEVAKIFEQNLPDEEFLDHDPEKKDTAIGTLTVRQGFASKKAFIAHALDSLLHWPNIVGVDTYKWSRVFHYYVKENLSLETAFHAATIEQINYDDNRRIRRIVSFNEEYNQLQDFERIDPKDFL